MDVKAMAKSKRSHTQHHSKKSYPKPNARDNMDAAKADGKSNCTSGRKVVEKKPVQSRAAELPSNSDRYLDENDLDSEDLLHGVASSSQGTDVIKPKSKGADYRYLISEARSQTHSTDYMDLYSSLDEMMPDLNQGFGDMLSVRGEAILSWTAADYFIVEEKESPNYEASCLSLNLNTLNKQLAKVDLAQRLFIEPDILPPELVRRPHMSELKDVGLQQQFPSTVENMASKTDPGVANFPQSLVQDVTVMKEVAVTSSNFSDDDDLDDAALSALKVKSQVKDNISPDPSKRLPTFEAFQAEAELDMLLDSLGETDVQVSLQIPSMQPHSVTEIQTLETAPVLDDAIDDLLDSTSYMTKTAPGLDDATDDLLGSTSYMTKTAPGRDNAIDDLLDATSYMRIMDDTFNSHKVLTETNQTAKNSDSSSKAKMVDDFDSWLETLG
ncbi:unnamed protein product [Rhodiola kirilowii]